MLQNQLLETKGVSKMYLKIKGILCLDYVIEIWKTKDGNVESVKGRGPFYKELRVHTISVSSVPFYQLIKIIILVGGWPTQKQKLR